MLVGEGGVGGDNPLEPVSVGKLASPIVKMLKVPHQGPSQIGPQSYVHNAIYLRQPR